MSNLTPGHCLALLLLLVGSLTLGCSPTVPESTEAPETSASPEPEAQIIEPEADEEVPEGAVAEVTAWVQVLDIDGEPLPDMAPIVTLQPNAFDAPLAVGAWSDADGQSSIRFPGDLRLYLRAWDPDLRYFPNNFYDILPNTGNTVRDVSLWMVEGGIIEMLLRDADGGPVAGQQVEMMMYHPERGPWWPADTETDDQGYARFETVPAGSYQLRLQTESGGRLEIPEVNLRPGATANLGVQQLRN